MAKTFADNTVEKIARAAGASVQLCWEVKGPKDTAIAWLSCYLVNHALVIVETFDSGGWTALVEARPDTNRIDDTLTEILNRCKVPVPDDLGAKYEITFIGHRLGKNEPSVEHKTTLKGPINLQNVEARLYDAGWAVNSVKNIGAPA